MIRNKSILILTSLVVLIAMAFIDTSQQYLENEELMENREGESEEVKEGNEGKEWMKFSFGVQDYCYEDQFARSHQLTLLCVANPTSKNTLLNKDNTPLFLKYCCLKIHLG